jgi:hypothetical protein
MAKHARRRNRPQLKVPDHPVIPGSVLYRALEQVASAVAQRLVEIAPPVEPGGKAFCSRKPRTEPIRRPRELPEDTNPFS